MDYALDAYMDYLDAEAECADLAPDTAIVMVVGFAPTITSPNDDDNEGIPF